MLIPFSTGSLANDAYTNSALQNKRPHPSNSHLDMYRVPSNKFKFDRCDFLAASDEFFVESSKMGSFERE